MGKSQRGVHFDFVRLKRSKETSNFLLQICAQLFSDTIFKHLKSTIIIFLICKDLRIIVFCTIYFTKDLGIKTK
jgi:hypothetical protein